MTKGNQYFSGLAIRDQSGNFRTLFPHFAALLRFIRWLLTTFKMAEVLVNQGVRERGVEPLRVLPHRLLRPARLPVSPLTR